jgi:hypothetical protein
MPSLVRGRSDFGVEDGAQQFAVNGANAGWPVASVAE